MELLSTDFKNDAAKALADPVLQKNLSRLKGNFLERRQRARESLPEFDTLRDEAKAIKDHTLAHLDLYLEHFEAQVRATGGQVHWARDAAQARAIVLDICRAEGARTVTKGKSMIAEEIGRALAPIPFSSSVYFATEAILRFVPGVDFAALAGLTRQLSLF